MMKLIKRKREGTNVRIQDDDSSGFLEVWLLCYSTPLNLKQMKGRQLLQKLPQIENLEPIILDMGFILHADFQC